MLDAATDVVIHQGFDWPQLLVGIGAATSAVVALFLGVVGLKRSAKGDEDRRRERQEDWDRERDLRFLDHKKELYATVLEKCQEVEAAIADAATDARVAVRLIEEGATDAPLLSDWPAFRNRLEVAHAAYDRLREYYPPVDLLAPATVTTFLRGVWSSVDHHIGVNLRFDEKEYPQPPSWTDLRDDCEKWLS